MKRRAGERLVVLTALLLFCFVGTAPRWRSSEALHGCYGGLAGSVEEDPQFNVSKISQFSNESSIYYTSRDVNYTTQHTNNWAVLVDTSIFWHNYRHIANTLSMYRTVRRLGIPDSQIILMIADDMACDPRNAIPGSIFDHKNHKLNVYGTDIEIDYRGYEVSVENFIRLLTGRHHKDVPRSKRLLTDDRSNILIYMTGHGGDEFLKFQDYEEICSKDLADAFEQMWEKQRYHEIFFMVDTCQATTLYEHFRSPNILAVGSSAKGENSYSHHTDSHLGIAMIDRFTYHTLEYFEGVNLDSTATVADLFSVFSHGKLGAHPKYRADLFQRPINQTLLTDFFGSVLAVEPTSSSYIPPASPLFDSDAEHLVPSSASFETSNQATSAGTLLPNHIDRNNETTKEATPETAVVVSLPKDAFLFASAFTVFAVLLSAYLTNFSSPR
ncbi:glycosylphosphatidylinositol anchor biosynthesis [Balamuthia mandrillaris]